LDPEDVRTGTSGTLLKG